LILISFRSRASRSGEQRQNFAANRGRDRSGLRARPRKTAGLAANAQPLREFLLQIRCRCSKRLFWQFNGWLRPTRSRRALTATVPRVSPVARRNSLLNREKFPVLSEFRTGLARRAAGANPFANHRPETVARFHGFTAPQTRPGRSHALRPFDGVDGSCSVGAMISCRGDPM
jgi:hypothetical protein